MLEDHFVEFKVTNNSIKSTHIPVILLNIDKRLYAKGKGMTLNPFVHVSNIVIEFPAHVDGELKIHLNIMRGLTFPLLGVVMSFPVLFGETVMLFFLVASGLFYLFEIEYLALKRIPYFINGALKNVL